MVLETTKPALVILDPTSSPLPANAQLAKRPVTLDGKVLGLLDNHKPNAARLLDEIQELLSQNHEFAGVVRRYKLDVSRPCPEETVEELAAQCDLLITAIGD